MPTFDKLQKSAFRRDKSQISAFWNCRHLACCRVFTMSAFQISIVGNLESSSSVGPADAAYGDPLLSEGILRTRPWPRIDTRNRAGRLLPIARTGRLLFPRRRSALAQLRRTASYRSRLPYRRDYRTAVFKLQQCPATPPLPPDAARYRCLNSPAAAGAATATVVAGGNAPEAGRRY
jgi:hypothetical protein